MTKKKTTKKKTTRRVGRPLGYNAEIQAKTEFYLANHNKKNAEGVEAGDAGYFEEIGDIVPSVAGLCVYLDELRSTLYSWAEKKECKEFSDTLEKIQRKQEQLLLNGGLTGETNSTITKLMLCNHGYSDKIVSDNNDTVTIKYEETNG